MKPLSNIIEKTPSSPIRMMFERAQGVEGVINLGLGEPGYTAAPHIVAAAKEAIDSGKTRYSPNAGILPLREAIAQHMPERKGMSYDPGKEIMVTTGGMEAIYLVIKVLTDPGEEVMIGAPYYGNYLSQIQMSGAVPKVVALKEENDFKYDIEDLEYALTEKTKVLFINSPCNPTGTVLDEHNLRDIAAFCLKHDLYLISDEVYQDFIYSDTSYFSVVTVDGMRERTVIIDSFSKTYAMTGWRCGYILGPEAIIQQMVKIQEYVVSCVTTPSQYAAMAAINGPQDTLELMKEQYGKNRLLVMETIETIPLLSMGTPEGAFYAFINIKESGMSSVDFCVSLLEREHVVLSPGVGFGEEGEGFVRMSYVSSHEDMKRGLERLRHFMETLASF